jgi:hypothetical protein
MRGLLNRWPWLRAPLVLHFALLVVLAWLFLVADAICYQITVPISLDLYANTGTITVGSQTFALGALPQPVALVVPPHDPLVHEYQIDGTDSTNNFTLDTAYLSHIQNSAYYRFQAWMRDLAGTSAWRDVQVTFDGRVEAGLAAVPDGGATLPLPQTATELHITLRWQRPEIPVTLTILTANQDEAQIMLDRNDRVITIQPTEGPAITHFFPVDVAPFAAMVMDFLVRTLLWAVEVIFVAWFVDAWAAFCVILWQAVGSRLPGGSFFARRWPWRRQPSHPARTTKHAAAPAAPESDPQIHASLPEASGTGQNLHVLVGRAHEATTPLPALATNEATEPPGAAPTGAVAVLVAEAPQAAPHHPSLAKRLARSLRRRLAGARLVMWASLHPVALVALAFSFGLTVWIALAQYHALPHIYDATAYLFGAKMLASGHLFLTPPPAMDRFPGPFMVLHDGRWFTQYAPGTALTLAAGVLLGVPWLVEPLLGTLALLGIGLIAARLCGRAVASLAVILGVLSPFYSYIAASYLSHTIALFYLVWGTYLLLRVAQGGARWQLPSTALLFGMAGLTRDLIAVLFVVIVLVGITVLHWRQIRARWRRLLIPLLGFGSVALAFVVIYLAYNALLTGSALTTPRDLFFSGDHWGFGPGVGFYGQHTLAAGFVTVDELLTSLAIDLFGWPFYLTLALLALPFLTLRVRAADWFLLAGAAIMTGAFLGYYYHGIYLGPRYLYETLPFLLILTARGIVTLAQSGRALIQQGIVTGSQDIALPRRSLGTWVIMLALTACSLLYFWPRQIVLHTNFTGESVGTIIQTAELAHPPVHHAIVMTPDRSLYGYTLFALNDPSFSGDVLFAEAATPADFQELAQAYPDRALYLLTIDAAGRCHYTLVTPGKG